MLRDKRTVKVNQDDGVLWIASGKIFPLPKEAKYQFPSSLKKNKPFALLKIVSPYSGVVTANEETVTIHSKDKKVSLSNIFFVVI